MNPNDPNHLIAESELRDALQIHRPEAARFAQVVHQRVAELRSEVATRASASEQKRLDWLRTAASVIPLPLLAKGAGGALGKGVGTGGPWAAKVVGWLASGPLILLLAAGGFLLGFQRIRSAQRRSASAEPGDPSNHQRVTEAWWKASGAFHIAICVAAVLLMLIGHTVPALIVFLVYGIAIVALVTRLGQQGLIDRTLLAMGIAQALMVWAGLISVVAKASRGTFLLDQSLAAAIMCLGACVVALCGCVTAKLRLQRIFSVVAVIPLLILVAIYGSSALFPMTHQDVRTYVESTDIDRFGAATWQRWALAAGWLRDTGQPFDPAQPRASFEEALAGDKNPYVMASAYRGGLVDLADAKKILAAHTERAALLSDPSRRGRWLSSIEQRAAEIYSLEQLGLLTPEDRAVLADRLIATINHAATSEYGTLKEVLVATQLLHAIDRADAMVQVRNRVHAMIVDFQYLETQRLFNRAGGFRAYRKSDSSDESATAVAVELMQLHGVPNEVDTLALRSFLRPKNTDARNRQGAILRVVALWRFESLPDAPSLTWWDYLRREHVIGMAILAVLLSVTAVVGFPSAQMTPEASEADQQDK